MDHFHTCRLQQIISTDFKKNASGTTNLLLGQNIIVSIVMCERFWGWH